MKTHNKHSTYIYREKEKERKKKQRKFMIFIIKNTRKKMENVERKNKEQKGMEYMYYLVQISSAPNYSIFVTNRPIQWMIYII